MKPVFLFLHGWAMQPVLWDPVRARLAGWIQIACDAGYFGSAQHPDLPAGAPVIAVGHSLGFMQLLDNPPPRVAGLVAINGFTRFTATPDHPAGIPARLVQRMDRRLGQDADATVTGFRRACGLSEQAVGLADPSTLRRGLEMLQHGDHRAALAAFTGPVMALAGEDDAIAPPELSRACFQAPAVRLCWVGEAGHLLPLTHPDRCAAALLDFASGLAT